jgi:hypothetical protein
MRCFLKTLELSVFFVPMQQEPTRITYLSKLNNKLSKIMSFADKQAL